MSTLPTWLQTERELHRLVAMHENRHSTVHNVKDLVVYKEMACEFNFILSNMPLKIVHGYNSKGNWYELAWQCNSTLNRLLIQVTDFNGTNLKLRASTGENWQKPIEVDFPKENMFSWLKQIVDEIFLQAL